MESIGLVADAALAPEDDFLAIGGNSLRQITVARRVCAELGRSIPLGLFIKNTKMSALATAIDIHIAENNDEIGIPFAKWTSTTTDLSHLERELYNMHTSSNTPSSFNVAQVIELSGLIQLQLLKQAIQIVVSANDIFHTSYVTDNSSLQRRIHQTELDIPITNEPA